MQIFHCKGFHFWRLGSGRPGRHCRPLQGATLEQLSQITSKTPVKAFEFEQKIYGII